MIDPNPNPNSKNFGVGAPLEVVVAKHHLGVLQVVGAVEEVTPKKLMINHKWYRNVLWSLVVSIKILQTKKNVLNVKNRRVLLKIMN